MLRAMVFIDYENFDIAKYNYYKRIQTSLAIKAALENGEEAPDYIRITCPSLDYNKIPKEIVKQIDTDIQLIKTFLFVPRPEGILSADQSRVKRFEWQMGMKNQNCFDVIAGRHTARPMAGFTKSTMSIDNQSSYYVEEKGTDVNLATQVLTKAFHNSMDVAVIVSGDTDYIPVMDVLNSIGKLVAVVGVDGQSLMPFKQHSDYQILLNEDFFKNCYRD